jgi:hypothetical protein
MTHRESARRDAVGAAHIEITILKVQSLSVAGAINALLICATFF